MPAAPQAPDPPPTWVEQAALERWLAAARIRRVQEGASSRQRSSLDVLEVERGHTRWISQKKAIE